LLMSTVAGRRGASDSTSTIVMLVSTKGGCFCGAAIAVSANAAAQITADVVDLAQMKPRLDMSIFPFYSGAVWRRRSVTYSDWENDSKVRRGLTRQHLAELCKNPDGRWLVG